MPTIKIVRQGRWIYDGSVELPVDIVGLNYDYWFEYDKSDDALEEGQTPMPAGESGLIYYARFSGAGQRDAPTVVDTGGHPSVQQAMSAARAKVGAPIAWDPE